MTEPRRSRYRRYLVRRIALRLQANAEGGLSERALQQAKGLANEADVRVTPPRRRAVAAGDRPAAFGIARAPVATHSRLLRPAHR